MPYKDKRPPIGTTKLGDENAKRNVAAILALEQKERESRSLAERFSDRLTNEAGRIGFIAAHGIWFGGWMLFNSSIISTTPKFDPFPCALLTLIVSLEAIFLSLFILMSQNRATRQADARSHLDLQINLLAEQEATKMLTMLQSLCAYHKLSIADDPDLAHLQAPTEPARLLDELKANFPPE